ncbi:MAG: helix-turn-helix domain-containing protein [Oligoflexales bacterium]
MKFDEFLNRAIEELKLQRVKLGMTQDQLAARVNKQQSVIARFEKGIVRDPRLSMFFDICTGLDISPSAVFEKAAGKGTETPESEVVEKNRIIRSKLKQLNKSARGDLEIINDVFKLM